MAFVQLSGPGTFIPPPPSITALSLSSSVIDATGEKLAWTGRVWTPNRGTKSIRNVGFLFGTVTKAGGSGLTVSLQDPSLTANPTQPDETQDQTVAIANGDSGFTSNAWYTTGNLSADRSVAFGEALSVVVEYDGSGRLGSDAVNFRNPGFALFGGAASFPAVTLKTASWALQSVAPNIVLVFSDGTFGTLAGGFPCSAISNVAFKQDTAGSDEYAVEIPITFKCKVDGFWIVFSNSAATGDFDVVLYDGTTAMTGGTVSHEANWLAGGSETRLCQSLFSQEIELNAGTTYRLAVKPTQTTSTVTLWYFDVSVAGHMGLHTMGENCVLTSRIDGGSWAAATSTRRPLLGLRVSSLDDGAGGGGGGGSSYIIGG